MVLDFRIISTTQIFPRLPVGIIRVISTTQIDTSVDRNSRVVIYIIVMYNI